MPTCRSVWTSIWPDKAVINFEFDVSCLKSWFLCLWWSAQPGLAKVLSERNFGRPLTVRAVITGDRIVGDHTNIQHRQFLLEPVLNMTQPSSPREIAASEDLSWQFYRRTYYALGLSSPHDCGCCYRLCPGKAHQCNVPGLPELEIRKAQRWMCSSSLVMFFLCGSAASLDMSWHLQQHTMIIVLILCTNKVPATIIRYELFLLAVTSYSVTCCSLTYACLQV